MKRSLKLSLTIIFISVISLNVRAAGAADPPAPVNFSLDYSAAVTQPGSTATSINLSGVLSFNINKITSEAEFNDFVQKTTIAVIHNGATDSKTLEAYLGQADPTYLTTKKAAAITAKNIADFQVKITLTGAKVGDQVVITGKVGAGAQSKPVTLTVAKDPDASTGVVATSPSTLTLDPNLETYLDGVGGDKMIDGVALSTIRNMPGRYDKEGNKAYLLVDQNGELIDNYPVNIDQDDIIYLIIVGKKDKIKGYTGEFTGTYAPSDLQMRSFAAIDPNFKPNDLVAYDPNDYDVVVRKRGPFTSANVVVKVKDNAANGAVISTYTLTVNTLFHLGFGVGFNRTSLENPDYVVAPLNSTQNTLVKTNGGPRNLVSVNVIWYWGSTLRYLLRGSNITEGRDVLKEPNFLERINPTFGFAFTGNVTDNMFAGLTFEFARGGSLFGGYHFGVVKRLAYPEDDFVPGQTVFTGAQTDIKTSNVSEHAWAFGLILDTRILNALFKKGS